MIVARISKSGKVDSKRIANNIAIKFRNVGWDTRVVTMRYSYIVHAVAKKKKDN